MSDIASLGFDIDSKPLAEANKEVAKMPAGAAKAERSVKSLSESVNKLSTTSSAAAAAAARVANDNGTVAKALGATDAAYKAATANAQNLAKAYQTLSASATKAANDNANLARRSSQYSRAPSGWGQPPVPMAGATGGSASGGAGGAGGAGSALATAAGAAAIAKVAAESDKAEKAVIGLRSALSLVLTAALGFGGSLVSAFGLAKFVSQTEIVSDSLGELGKTWSQLFIVGKEAAVPLALAIDALAEAFDNPVFRGFVHTIGQLLFGAMRLAVEGVTMLVNGFIVLLENIDTIQVALLTAGTLLVATFGPAILSGIAYGFGVMGAAGIAAIRGITAAMIANPFGALVVGITAAVTALYYFRDEIKQAIGIDVIGIVKRAANYVIGSFVAAYGDIKFLWSSFPDIIGAAVIGAANAVARGMHEMLQTAARGIDWLIEQANKIPGVNLGKIGDLAPLQQVPNPYADRLAAATQNRGTQQQEELNRDYLGALGNMLKLSGQGPKKFTDDLGAAGAAAKKLKEETDKAAESYAKILGYGQDFIAMQEAERAGIGLSVEAAARLRFEQDLLNRARKAGIDLAPEQIAQLQALAGAMAAAQERTRHAKEEFEFWKSTFKGFFSDLKQGIEQGKSIWDSFGNAAMNALSKISDKLFEMATTKLFESAFGGSGGGGGGLFSGIINAVVSGISAGAGGGIDIGPGTGYTYAKGAAFSAGNVIPFARGTVVNRPTLFPMANATGLMGEAGPEAIMPLVRGPGGSLGVRAHGGGAPAAQVIRIEVSADSDWVRVVARDESGKMVAQASPRIVARAVDRSREEVVPTMNRHEAERGGDYRVA